MQGCVRSAVRGGTKRRRLRPAAVLLSAALGAALLIAAGAVSSQPGSIAARAATDVSDPVPVAEISNSTSRGFTYASVIPGHSVGASRRPGTRPYKRLPAYTEMGSPRRLPIVKVRSDWLGVAPTMRRNGKLAWIKRDSEHVRFVRTSYSVRVKLSSRLLELRKGSRVVRRVRVAIGRPGSPTPTGRFAITDKLNGRAISSYYGCCVLALNGHQPNLPAGWRGGNRLAIHGTNDPGSIGKASSAGCLRARDRDLRVLMERLPAGAPVFVRR